MVLIWSVLKGGVSIFNIFTTSPFGIGVSLKLFKKKYFKKSQKIQFEIFLDWNFTLFGVSNNHISLHFCVPNNQISLCLEAPDKKISLHLGILDNCSWKISSQQGLGPLEQISGTPK